MPISKTYNPKEAEKKWYSYWMEHNFFHSEPDPNKESYSIVIPPPNVTGVLHMGHMLNNTIQDVLIRKKRMEGKEACWVPGTDHASIATEAKVVAMLREKGIKKSDIGREKFLEHAWEWKEKYGGIILEQLKKLGASCDWERTRFTMEDDLYDAVIDVFIDLYNKGYIYRGLRMVNWDPQGKTALSDEEVIHKEVNSKLYHVKYALADDTDKASGEWLTIATTRPETILGDTAICVNPEDKRYTHLKGKKAIVPFVGRLIPIIFDEYVDVEFGTGCLKVTPAHDTNDYELGKKHQLETIDILNADGSLSENAIKYVGEDRFKARKLIVKDLEAAGQLVEVEDITNNVGYSERTDAVIEPRLSKQWFVDMKKFLKNNPEVLDAVMNDEIKLHPAKFKNTYKHWMENIKDWCISRQLWWGQQIPAWYTSEDDFVVARDAGEAVSQFKERGIEVTQDDIKQDEDVLDTWFSSWLWPITVFDGFKKPNNPDFKYYYPTNDLVTAPEILFFWVARMIMAGYEYRDEKPFKNVYLHGIVRDKQRRKMSKSLGNSPDPLDLIDEYGADGVRVGMLLSAPAGNDLLFDEKLCLQGRNFSNKLWNAFRLVKGWEIVDGENAENQVAIDWFNSKCNEALIQLEDHFDKYRISDALMTVYKLVWDDFCSWYLEMIKPEYQQPIDKFTFEATISFFERIVKLVHPFMPFITEEVWHEIRDRKDDECVIVAQWPQKEQTDGLLIEKVEKLKDVVSGINDVIQSNGIKKETKLEVYINTESKDDFVEFYKYVILKMIKNNNAAVYLGESLPGEKSLGELHIPPFDVYVYADIAIDVDQKKEEIETEIAYLKGFLVSVDKKLSNERFVNGAPPQVVENEKKKKADAETKIKALEESLSNLVN